MGSMFATITVFRMNFAITCTFVIIILHQLCSPIRQGNVKEEEDESNVETVSSENMETHMEECEDTDVPNVGVEPVDIFNDTEQFEPLHEEEPQIDGNIIENLSSDVPITDNDKTKNKEKMSSEKPIANDEETEIQSEESNMIDIKIEGNVIAIPENLAKVVSTTIDSQIQSDILDSSNSREAVEEIFESNNAALTDEEPNV